MWLLEKDLSKSSLLSCKTEQNQNTATCVLGISVGSIVVNFRILAMFWRAFLGLQAKMLMMYKSTVSNTREKPVK